MSKSDTMLRALRRELGSDYTICTIDLERVLYRDFGNGFNVEISGVRTTKVTKPATLYLWFGSDFIVKTVHDVPRSMIGTETDALFAYTKQLIADGCDNRDAVFYMLNPELKEWKEAI